MQNRRMIAPTIAVEFSGDLPAVDGLEMSDALAEEFLIKNSKMKEWEEPWSFQYDDPTVVEAVAFLQQRLSDDFNPVYQILCFDSLNQASKFDYDFVAAYSIGDDVSNAEKSHHTDSEIICETCGNRYQDPDFIPLVVSQKLRKKSIFMSMYGDMKFLCRPKFIDLYEAANLSGLSFKKLTDVKAHGDQIYRVLLHQHKWKNREGVCEVCEMKTNVRSPAYFNLDEDYSQDFQYVRVFDRHDYVLSQKAMTFLDEHTNIGVRFEYCAAPIMPGYLADKIYPENKLFAHGECPTKVLR